MKKVLGLILAFTLIFTVSVFALGDNENEQAQGQIGINRSTNVNDLVNRQNQGQLQGQAQGQGQMQGQAAISAQAQGQGQISNGEVETNVSGDESKDRTYAVSYPSLTGGEGVSQANAYSIFGGVGLSQTEEYKTYIIQIQAIEASQTLSNDEKKVLVSKLFDKMLSTNKTKRFLGVLWETSGRNLLNGVGLLSWDSFWKDGETPADKITKPRVRTDTEITGNAGNVDHN